MSLTNEPIALPYGATSRGDSSACLRCRYDLRGVADEAPCPECGLLASRSRRPSDALRDARPGWLRSLTIGVWMILLAIPVVIAWSAVTGMVRSALYDLYATTIAWWLDLLIALTPFFGWQLGGLLFFFGSVLLTRPEGYPPADDADRRRRRWIRLMSLVVPLLFFGMALPFVVQSYWPRTLYWSPIRLMYFWGVVAAMAILVPLPLIGMQQLKSLANRLGSGHLVEHCVIVGWCASCTLVVTIGTMIVVEHATQLGLPHNWMSRSTSSILVLLATSTASTLSVLWFLYVLVRFAIFFARESRALRNAWKVADRATMVNTTT